MFNVLLDSYPQSYKGYRIDTDFQIGIQITQCLDDEQLNEYERIAIACSLLYQDYPPEIKACVEGLTWFLNGWNHDKHTKINNVRSFDFDLDQWRIYSAFRSQYGIDLNIESMHWFSFMGLLCNLEECSFTRVVEIRTKKITGKMQPEERKALKEAKLIYQIKNDTIESSYSEEEQKSLEEFMKYAKIKN